MDGAKNLKTPCVRYHRYIIFHSLVKEKIYICCLLAGRSVLGKTVPEVLSTACYKCRNRLTSCLEGIWSSRHQEVSPPVDHLATNHLATKQSLLTTNNLITVNHKPNRLIRCLCYVERRVAITYQATSYNSLVLSHKRLEHCVVHFNDAKVFSHKRLEKYIVHFNNAYVNQNETANSAIATLREKSC